MDIHPPTEVHVRSFLEDPSCRSFFEQQQQQQHAQSQLNDSDTTSPLSSAPNSPQRPMYDSDDSPRQLQVTNNSNHNNIDSPVMTNEAFQALKATWKRAEEAAQQSRESRKSRIRARWLEEKKQNSSFSPVQQQQQQQQQQLLQQLQPPALDHDVGDDDDIVIRPLPPSPPPPPLPRHHPARRASPIVAPVDLPIRSSSTNCVRKREVVITTTTSTDCHNNTNNSSSNNNSAMAAEVVSTDDGSSTSDTSMNHHDNSNEEDDDDEEIMMTTSSSSAAWKLSKIVPSFQQAMQDGHVQYQQQQQQKPRQDYYHYSPGGLYTSFDSHKDTTNLSSGSQQLLLPISSPRSNTNEHDNDNDNHHYYYYQHQHHSNNNNNNRSTVSFSFEGDEDEDDDDDEAKINSSSSSNLIMNRTTISSSLEEEEDDEFYKQARQQQQQQQQQNGTTENNNNNNSSSNHKNNRTATSSSLEEDPTMAEVEMIVSTSSWNSPTEDSSMRRSVSVSVAAAATVTTTRSITSPSQQLDPSLDEELKDISMIALNPPEDEEDVDDDEEDDDHEEGYLERRDPSTSYDTESMNHGINDKVTKKSWSPGRSAILSSFQPQEFSPDRNSNANANNNNNNNNNSSSDLSSEDGLLEKMTVPDNKKKTSASNNETASVTFSDAAQDMLWSMIHGVKKPVTAKNNDPSVSTSVSALNSVAKKPEQTSAKTPATTLSNKSRNGTKTKTPGSASTIHLGDTTTNLLWNMLSGKPLPNSNNNDNSASTNSSPQSDDILLDLSSDSWKSAAASDAPLLNKAVCAQSDHTADPLISSAVDALNNVTSNKKKKKEEDYSHTSRTAAESDTSVPAVECGMQNRSSSSAEKHFHHLLANDSDFKNSKDHTTELSSSSGENNKNNNVARVNTSSSIEMHVDNFLNNDSDFKAHSMNSSNDRSNNRSMSSNNNSNQKGIQCSFVDNKTSESNDLSTGSGVRNSSRSGDFRKDESEQSGTVKAAPAANTATPKYWKERSVVENDLKLFDEFQQDEIPLLNISDPSNGIASFAADNSADTALGLIRQDYYNGSILDDDSGDAPLMNLPRQYLNNRSIVVDPFSNLDEGASSSDETPLITNGDAPRRRRKNNPADHRRFVLNAIGRNSSGNKNDPSKQMSNQQKRWQKGFKRHKQQLEEQNKVAVLPTTHENSRAEAGDLNASFMSSMALEIGVKAVMDVCDNFGNLFLGDEPLPTLPSATSDLTGSSLSPKKSPQRAGLEPPEEEEEDARWWIEEEVSRRKEYRHSPSTRSESSKSFSHILNNYSSSTSMSGTRSLPGNMNKRRDPEAQTIDRTWSLEEEIRKRESRRQLSGHENLSVSERIALGLISKRQEDVPSSFSDGMEMKKCSNLSDSPLGGAKRTLPPKVLTGKTQAPTPNKENLENLKSNAEADIFEPPSLRRLNNAAVDLSIDSIFTSGDEAGTSREESTERVNESLERLSADDHVSYAQHNTTGETLEEAIEVSAASPLKFKLDKRVFTDTEAEQEQNELESGTDDEKMDNPNTSQVSFTQINTSGDALEEILDTSTGMISKSFASPQKRNRLSFEDSHSSDEYLFPDTSSDLKEQSNTEPQKTTAEGLLDALDDMVKDLDETLDVEAKEIDESYTKGRNHSTELDLSSDTGDSETLKDIKAVSSPSQTITSVQTEIPAPILLDAIDSDIGIPRGDIMISLLRNSTANAADGSPKPYPWSKRVGEAIWRCRTMRRNCDTRWLKQRAEHKIEVLEKRKRSAVPVDVDDVRVLGCVDTIESTQAAVLENLKFDDFEDALVLYESILESYSDYINELNCTAETVCTYKSCIATSLYNMGIIRMLNGDFKDAHAFFERSTRIRSVCLGDAHPDHVASLVKMSTCLFAMEEFPKAHASLEEAANLCKSNCVSIQDHRQLAEILNNLGCLSHLCGEVGTALQLFRESMELQMVISENSMYMGSRYSCHTVTINMSIIKANIGFIALSMRNIPDSVTELESAFRDQLLLLRDAHDTLTTTMEHLVIANIAAGRKARALQLLRRMLHMQIDAFGADNEKCKLTGKKIYFLEHQEVPEQSECPSDSDVDRMASIDEVSEASKLSDSFDPSQEI